MQLNETHPALENVIFGGPGYVKEDAFCVCVSESTEVGDMIRLFMTCHINHLFGGAEGETWELHVDPKVEYSSHSLYIRLVVDSITDNQARVIWYEIPTGLYLNADTLTNYLEKTFEGIF